MNTKHDLEGFSEILAQQGFCRENKNTILYYLLPTTYYLKKDNLEDTEIN